MRLLGRLYLHLLLQLVLRLVFQLRWLLRLSLPLLPLLLSLPLKFTLRTLDLPAWFINLFVRPLLALLGIRPGAQADERKLTLLRNARPQLERATPDDVKRVAAKYLTPGKAWKLMVVPDPKAAASSAPPSGG